MKLGKGNLSGRQKLILSLLFFGPLLLMVGKWSALPTSAFLTGAVSLTHLSAPARSHVMYILSVPFGAVVVVLFRLFLGIRLLGPFRSILIAVAFQITGIVPGLAFLAAVIGIVVMIRPIIRAIRLPYFARVSVLLSLVASLMLVALLAGRWLGVASLERMMYLPIVVLCLLGEGFAKTLANEGMASALWRGAMTALVAVFITFLFEIRGFRGVFLRFPELVIIEVGGIIAIGEFLDLRLLAWLNPPARNKPSPSPVPVIPPLSEARE